MTDIVERLRFAARDYDASRSALSSHNFAEVHCKVLISAADEIERLREELAENARIIGMSSEREAKLLGEIDRLKSALARADEGCNYVDLYEQEAR